MLDLPPVEIAEKLKTDATLSEFLTAFFPTETEQIEIRGFEPRNSLTKAETVKQVTITREELACDAELQQFLVSLNKTHGVYFVVNSGGRKDADIARFNACFAESDNLSIGEQYERLSRFALSPSVMVQTKKSVHAYWLLEENCTESDWREIQIRLIAFFGGDDKLKNPSRVMRLPHFNHVALDGEKVVHQKVFLTHFEPTARYAAAQLLEALPPVLNPNAPKESAPRQNPDEFLTWEALNGEARRRMLNHRTVNGRGEWRHLKGVCHDGVSDTGLAVNLATGAFHCHKGCTTAQILAALGLPDKPQTTNFNSPEVSLFARRENALPGSPPPLDAQAEKTPIKRFTRASEVADQVRDLYARGLPPGLSTGWQTLDQHYTVKKQQWTLVTGKPGDGKTSFVNALHVNLAKIHNWRFAVCSPESHPIERHIAELIAIWAREPFGELDYMGKQPRLSRETLDAGLEWVNEHFVFVTPPDDEFNLPGVLAAVDEINQVTPVDGVVIDPWNSLSHRRPSNMREDEFVNAALTMIIRFAITRNQHVWLVAHPTKLRAIETKFTDDAGAKVFRFPVATPYDISGAAHFYNQAFNAISVYRDIFDERNTTQIHIQKIKFRECGKLGKVDLIFDYGSGTFADAGETEQTFSATSELVPIRSQTGGEVMF